MSNSLPGNPHAAKIAALAPELATMLDDPRATTQDAIGVATIQATIAAQMAIAHEVRTANLIEARYMLAVGSERNDLTADIRTRLGLNGDQK